MADIREALNGGPEGSEDFYSYSSQNKEIDYEEKEETTNFKKGYSFEQELPNISAFESTNGSTVDDILRSLQQSSSHSNSFSQEQEGGAGGTSSTDSAVTDWYSCLSDREKQVLERLALFEGRVEALQSMKEELYSTLVGED